MGWIFTIDIWIALAIAAAGVALLAWSLFWDRARGRKRCPKCWYDMAGAAGLVCPECGHDARREGRLRKTRRRWGWAKVGVAVALVGASTPLVQPVRERGWFALVPNAALIWMIPMPQVEGELEADVLRRRATWSELADRRQAGWIRLWEERMLMGRLGRAFPSDVDNLIVTRGRWPSGESVWIEVAPPWWMQGAKSRACVLTPRMEGMPGVRQNIIGSAVLLDGRGGSRLDRQHEIGAPPPGAHRIGFDVELLEFGYDRAGQLIKRNVVWRGETTMDVEVGGSADDIIAPFASKDLDEYIRDTHFAAVQVNAESDEGHIEIFGGSLMLERWSREHEGAVFGLRVELLRDDEAVASAITIVEAPQPLLGGIPLLGHYLSTRPLRRLSDRLYEPEIAGSDWTLRIVGDPSVALRYFEAQQCWVGEVVAPVWKVDVLFRSGTDEMEWTDHEHEGVEFELPPRRGLLGP